MKHFKNITFLICAVLAHVLTPCYAKEEVVVTVKDVDGNVYKTVKIGTQVWMAENLKTIKYNDNSPIPNVTGNAAWAALSTGAYCDYKNKPSNSTIYGRLYNWYAVNTGKLAPIGWHVATDAEWTTLTTYLGGEDVAGGKLKETGTTHWISPNDGATNETRFKALPCGDRHYYSGTFSNVGCHAYWWKSTVDDASYAWCAYVDCGISHIGRGSNNKANGFSVRCVRDF